MSIVEVLYHLSNRGKESTLPTPDSSNLLRVFQGDNLNLSPQNKNTFIGIDSRVFRSLTGYLLSEKIIMSVSGKRWGVESVESQLGPTRIDRGLKLRTRVNDRVE